MTATERRRRVLRLLESCEGSLTAGEIAARLDERPTTVKFHLDALVSDGVVVREPGAASGPGRPPVLYRAARSLRGDGATDYRLLASILVDALGAPASQDRHESLVDAGRRWGSVLLERTGARDVTGLLDALGFQPEPVTDDGDLVLRHCPFFDLAEARREIVCPVHLGILRGAADEVAPRTEVASLVPFAEPDACVAHLVGEVTGAF